MNDIGNNSAEGNGSKSKATSNGKGIRVVVADDFQPMLDTIVGMLEPHFDIVGTAEDGKTAQEMIEHLKPDVALLDISMPHKTGIEIAADLKTKGSDVKVVIISAYDDETYTSAADKAGAAGYVVKTRMTETLIPTLESAYAGNGNGLAH